MNYIKMSPIVGLSGFGGGAIAQTFAGAAAGGGTGEYQGDRGILFNGYTNGDTNVIQYFSISSTGNASDFGDTAGNSRSRGSVSDGTIGLCGGGDAIKNIDKITISTTGNSSDFGDLTVNNQCKAVGDGTYGIFPCRAGTDTIDYVTMATDGNASDWGNHTSTGNDGSGPTNDATRAVFFGGHGTGTSQGEIEYMTMETTGNCSDFGDCHDDGYGMNSGVVANSTRGVVAGGNNRSDTMEYVTIQTTGNGTDFGNLSSSLQAVAGCSDKDTGRGVFSGGVNGGRVNTMQYISIANPANTSDFGDMTISANGVNGLSGD